MDARAASIIQIIRANLESVKRDRSTISYAIATHEDSDAFILALTFAARNMPDEVVWCLEDSITDFIRYVGDGAAATVLPARLPAQLECTPGPCAARVHHDPDTALSASDWPWPVTP
jgi:hypothetical protein